MGLRLLLIEAIDFGNDEAYTLASARALNLSYFDHPPLHLWLAHAASNLVGEGLWVRLPFVLLFGVTGWLMFTVTRDLFDAAAGLWALLALNLTPFFTISAGGWVVPDGLLDLFLLAALRAVLPALAPDRDAGGHPWRCWLLAGLFLGLAGLSKYTAVLPALGFVAFLAASPVQRRWLAHPAPFAGALLALAVVSPVLRWNAQHDWVSFAFQSARGLPRAGLHPAQALSMLGGEIAFLSPWIALPVVVAMASAGRATAAGERRRLLLWLSLPTIVIFSVAPLWSSRGLPHWPMPGWLFVYPLFGLWVADTRRFPARAWALCSTLALLAVIGAGAALATFGLPREFADSGRTDATLETLDWSALPARLAARGLHPRFVVATRWMDAGKLAMAFGRAMPVFVFSDDPRQFAFGRPESDMLGEDAAIVVPARTLDETTKRLSPSFAALEPAEHVWLGRSGLQELDLAVVPARRLLAPYPQPYGTAAATGASR